MTAKEMQAEAAAYLSRYRSAKKEIKEIERRIERAQLEMMGVKGISYENGDMPKAPSRTGDLSDYIVRLDDLIQDWKAAQNRAILTMREISTAISAVQHDQARRILMLHFVDGKSYTEIQQIIPCGNNACFCWRRVGLMDIYNRIKPGSLE